MSCGGAEYGVKGGQSVVRARRLRLGGDADGGLGGGMEIGGEEMDNMGTESETG